MDLKDDEFRIVLQVNRLFHDLTSESYDEVHPEILKNEFIKLPSKLSRILERKEFGNVLDVGSGTGFMYMVLSRSIHFRNFYMLDISIGMLKLAKERFKALFVNGNALSMPFKDGSFDLITVNSVLHHLPDVKAFMDEARRVLKKGGYLILNHEPNLEFSKHTFLWYQSRFLQQLSRMLQPLRTLKRFVASFRKLRNPIYDRINEELIRSGLISKPLSYERISAYIDYLSPTAGYVRRNAGIDVRWLSEGFKIVHLETYDHLGKISEKYGSSSCINLYDTLMKRLFPKHGSKVFAVLTKV